MHTIFCRFSEVLLREVKLFWSLESHFLVKIDLIIDIFINSGRICSDRVQGGFFTQNEFTRSNCKGMPYFVPKFTF